MMSMRKMLMVMCGVVLIGCQSVVEPQVEDVSLSEHQVEVPTVTCTSGQTSKVAVLDDRTSTQVWSLSYCVGGLRSGIQNGQYVQRIESRMKTERFSFSGTFPVWGTIRAVSIAQCLNDTNGDPLCYWMYI